MLPDLPGRVCRLALSAARSLGLSLRKVTCFPSLCIFTCTDAFGEFALVFSDESSRLRLELLLRCPAAPSAAPAKPAAAAVSAVRRPSCRPPPADVYASDSDESLRTREGGNGGGGGNPAAFAAVLAAVTSILLP